MSINSGSIGSYAINGTSAGDDPIYDLALMTDAASLVYIANSFITEVMPFNDETLPYYTSNGEINDIMYNHDGNIASLVTSDSVLDTLNIVDTLFVVINELLSEAVLISDENTDIVQKVAVIIENIEALHSLISNGSISSVLSDGISYVDTAEFGILKAITEALSIADSLAAKLAANTEVEENIIFTYSLGEAARIFRETNELFIVSDALNNQSIVEQILTDYISFSVGIQRDLDNIAYLLSPETMSVSTYTNYNFKSACIFNDVPLFANGSGLYSHGGDTDNGADIEAKIKTAALSFGTPHLKRVLNLYLGLYNSDTIVLKASADGGETAYYQVSEASEGIQTQRMTLGKGMVGRYWQFELITQNNTIFELESLDFLPVSLSRRI